MRKKKVEEGTRRVSLEYVVNYFSDGQKRDDPDPRAGHQAAALEAIEDAGALGGLLALVDEQELARATRGGGAIVADNLRRVGALIERLCVNAYSEVSEMGEGAGDE